MDRTEFANLVGEPYLESNTVSNTSRLKNECEADIIDEDDAAYDMLVDMFDDDDLWISEWLYCRRMGIPFTYTLCDEHGESEHTISSADEFYDFLLEVAEDKETGSERYRYR